MAYTDEQKQLALTAYAACRNNATQAAKFCREHYDLAVSPDTLTLWSRGEYIAPEVLSSSEQVKKTLAEKCEGLADKLLDAMFSNYEGAKLTEQATTFGIVSDKMLLFRGQANSITQSNLSPDERALRLAELITRVQERKQQEAEK